jgi:hypothetical protein
MTLSAYITLTLEQNCDPAIDPEHPDYPSLRPTMRRLRSQNLSPRQFARSTRYAARGLIQTPITNSAFRARARERAMPFERFVALHLQDCTQANGKRTVRHCPSYAVRRNGNTFEPLR